jgi:hypothetical protein
MIPIILINNIFEMIVFYCFSHIYVGFTVPVLIVENIVLPLLVDNLYSFAKEVVDNTCQFNGDIILATKVLEYMFVIHVKVIIEF